MSDTRNSKELHISVLKSLVPYMKPYWLQVILASLALIVAAGTVLALGKGLQLLIDNSFVKDNPDLLDQSLLAMLGVVLVLALASFTRYFFVSWVGERVVADLRKDVFRNIIHLDPHFYEDNRAGDVISRITTDTTVLQSVIGSSISLAVRNLIMMAGALVMLMITSPKLTGLVVVVVPLVIIPILFWGRKVRSRSRIAQDRVASVGGFLDEYLHAIQTVQSNTRENATIEEFNGEVESAYRSAKLYILFRAVMSAVVISIVFCAVGIILWIGGKDVISGAMTPGELSAFVFYAVVVAGSVGILSEVMGNIQRANGAIERLFELRNQRPSIQQSGNFDVLNKPVQGKITFENVGLSYPSRPGINALDGISFPIKAGQTVAIVGPSGSGKTTLFNLLLRFYDPQQGRILIDDKDIKTLAFEDFRNAIAYVPQDPFIFSGTARDNIAFAKQNASDKEIHEAARQAHALEFIEKLPNGFDTVLGANGSKLSGGQKQRIAIARAILRNPAILLLDEATSALDSESESIVQKGLEQLMQGRTTLVIAHRLSTVKNADEIIVLDGGRIVENGKHNDLIDQKGLYANLSSYQFKAA